MLDSDDTFLLLKLKQRLEKQHKVKMSNIEIIKYALEANLENLEMSEVSSSEKKLVPVPAFFLLKIPVPESKKFAMKQEKFCSKGECRYQ